MRSGRVCAGRDSLPRAAERHASVQCEPTACFGLGRPRRARVTRTPTGPTRARSKFKPKTGRAFGRACIGSIDGPTLVMCAVEIPAVIGIHASGAASLARESDPPTRNS